MSDAAWMIAGLYVMVAAGFAVGCVKIARKRRPDVPIVAQTAACLMVAVTWPVWAGAFLPKLAAHLFADQVDD